jgi:fructokinase
MSRYGTVELGGTKTSFGAGSSPDDLESAVTVATTSPGETLGRVLEYFAGNPVEAVGIAAFGPVELRRDHPEYGRIKTTPKEGWSGVDIVGPIEAELGVGVGFDTDVNGAALGEARWGAGRDLASLVYVTVGTGIGGGALIEGAPVHGLGHPEMGHITVRRHPADSYEGCCRLHGDCLEGLASGPAIEGRFGGRGEDLSGGDLIDAVALEAFYLAQMMRDLIYTLAPQRIVLGGGVSRMPGLLEGVGEGLRDELAGYPGLPEHEAGFLVPPGLGRLSGLAGGLVLAEMALR